MGRAAVGSGERGGRRKIKLDRQLRAEIRKLRGTAAGEPDVQATLDGVERLRARENGRVTPPSRFDVRFTPKSGH